MILDEQLNFDEHVNYLHSRAVKRSGILRKSRYFLDQKPSLLLYKSLVLLHFNYCDTVSGCMSAANLRKMQILQNSACRTMLLGDRYIPTTQMHGYLNLSTLVQRRELHLSMACPNHVNSQSSSLNRYFKPRKTRATRVGDTQMQLPNLRTEAGKKAHSYRVSHHWENLPTQLNDIASKLVFKQSDLENNLVDELFINSIILFIIE